MHACLLKMLTKKQNMCNSKAVDATLMMSKLLKWIRPQTPQCIVAIMDQAIKQGYKVFLKLAHELD